MSSDPLQPHVAPTVIDRYRYKRDAMTFIETFKNGAMPSMTEEEGGWLLGRVLDLTTKVQSEVQPPRPAQQETEQQLKAWRQWAQFVYLGAGKWTMTDPEMRLAIAEHHDADVWSQLELNLSSPLPPPHRSTWETVRELLEDIYSAHRSRDSSDSDWEFVQRVGYTQDRPCDWCLKAAPIVARLRALQGTEK